MTTASSILLGFALGVLPFAALEMRRARLWLRHRHNGVVLAKTVIDRGRLILIDEFGREWRS